MGFIYSVSKTIYDNSGDLEIEYTFEDGTIETYNNYIIQEQ